MAKRRILQLGAGAYLTQSIRILQQRGYEVYAADRNPKSPGFEVADGHAALDIIDSDAIARYAEEIDAALILAVNEAGVLAASEASHRLGLPNLSPEIARKCLDKGLMRDSWKAAGLPQPAYRVVEAEGAIEKAAGEIGYPIILKPCWNWGSRGVSAVAGPEALEGAIAFAKSNNRNDRYIVEECLPGTEATVEGLIQNGVPQVLAISDKEHAAHPQYRVAMALNYPAKFPPTTLRVLDEVVGAAALALGIRNGAFHCECMVEGNEAHLVELGARGGGGHIFGCIVEAVSGISMPAALVQILFGEPVDIRPRYQRGACYRFFGPPHGVFERALGLEEARNLPGIKDLGLDCAPGTVVGATASDAERPGFVVATGDTRDEAIRLADRAISCVRFEMAGRPAGSG